MKASFSKLLFASVLACGVSIGALSPIQAWSDTEIKAEENNPEDAGAFLKSLEGSFRGRGMARMGPGDKERRVTCQISNLFQAENQSLKVDGECASTQGKGDVSGEISYSGGEVTGAFISPRKGVEMTQSSGAMDGGRLVVSVSLFDQQASRLTRTRQIIEKTEAGFSSTFFRFDNASGAYEQAGQLVFNRR